MKIQFSLLKGMLVISIIAVIILPVYNYFFLHPQFVKLIAEDTEEEAVHIANQIVFELFPNGVVPEHLGSSGRLTTKLHPLQKEFKVIKVKLFSPGGRVVFSTDEKDLGGVNREKYFTEIISKGKTYSKIVKKGTLSLEGQTMPADVVETYIPLVRNGSFRGAFEVYVDITKKMDNLADIMAASSFRVFTIACILLAAVVITTVRTRRTISERKKVEEALNKSERRYQVLAELSPVGIFYANDEGEYVYVNERWRLISGVSPQDAIGDGWLAALHPDDRQRVSRAWHRAVNNRTPFTMEFRFSGPARTTAFVLSQATPEKGSDGKVTGFVGTITDMTARKQAEAAERLASLGVVAAKVAHDIRNPIVSIAGFARRLERLLDGTLREYATIIANESFRLEAKLRDILSFTKESHLRVQTTDIHALFDEVFALYQEELCTRNIEVVKAFSAGETLFADAFSLREVLVNLITNAIQAIGNNGRIKVTTAVRDAKMSFTVSDTGPGIHERDLPHIFDTFYTTKVHGTGLGLSIVQRAVHEHSGTVEVQTGKDCGTTFTVTFPLFPQ